MSLLGLLQRTSATMLWLVVLVMFIVKGPWQCVMDTICCIRHQVFSCLGSFLGFYWLFYAVLYGRYGPSFWSLWLLLVLQICRFFWSMFWVKSLKLIFVVVDFNACVAVLVIPGISCMYALMCCSVVVISINIVIIVFSGTGIIVASGSGFFLIHWLFVIVLLLCPILNLAFCSLVLLFFLLWASLLVTLCTFDRLFLFDVSTVYLGCVTVVVLDFYLVLY